MICFEVSMFVLYLAGRYCAIVDCSVAYVYLAWRAQSVVCTCGDLSRPVSLIPGIYVDLYCGLQNLRL